MWASLPEAPATLKPSATPDLSISCHLLEKLPVELRFAIYELVFEEYEAEPIHLFDAQPPTNALLLSCRQICSEARKFYISAYQSYWTTTLFEITYSSAELANVRQWLETFDSQTLANVQNLRVRNREKATWSFYLIDVRGGWRKSEAGRPDCIFTVDKIDSKSGYAARPLPDNNFRRSAILRRQTIGLLESVIGLVTLLTM